jgi:hypothetical protein
MKKLYNAFLLLTLFIIIFTISVSAQFVLVNSEFADIRVRVLPETESIIVGKAFKDDIFRYISEENDWIEIEMFSGDARYIHRSLVNIFTHGVSAPFSNDICLKLIERLEEAKERSLTESDVKSQNVLFDRYVLDIFHEFGLQPVVFEIAVNRCSEGPESKVGQRPSEIKAGYTLGAPIEKIELKKEVISESKPKITEAPNQGNNYDFINTNWGMSKEEVKKIEKAEFIEENMGGEDNLQYKGKVDGLDCHISYFFEEGKLISAGCRITQPNANKNDYINDYKKLKEYLIKKYGKEFEDDIYEDQSRSAFWDTTTTEIHLFLLFLSEVNNKLDLSIYFKSKSETKLDTEKEKAKEEGEAQTEARIKELENKPKAEIKFIDSTSRLSGNYYYVEGIVKNNGKGNASYVKVEIRALDKYGKLVSINDGYADPSTLAPGQEATYQIMVEYDSKIDKFDKKVSWEND